MTIEEAVRVLLYEFYLEDSIYAIRDGEWEMDDGFFEDNPEASRWDAPSVKLYVEVCRVLKQAYPKDET